MKVYFNQSQFIQKNIWNNNFLKKKDLQNQSNAVCVNDFTVSNFVNYSNISFGKGYDANFLLSQTDRLLCAYSKKEMISPNLAKKISDKIQKKPNLLSAVNYLVQYQDRYMHDIESQIFDIFNDKDIKKRYGQKTFTDVLKDYKSDALMRLKTKEFKILTGTDKLVNKLSDPVKSLVTIIRNDSISKMENDTFSRKSPLEMLSRIKASGKDYEYLKAIYKAWYKLPSSSTDIDAFIVSYSDSSHKTICERLLSPSYATIEHVKPKTKGGMDCLSNYLLVSAEYNNNRSSRPLNEYIDFHSELDIPGSLQLYMDLVISEINRKDSAWSERAHYAYDIARTIEKETRGTVKLDTSKISVSNKKSKSTEQMATKLSKKYPVKKN